MKEQRNEKIEYLLKSKRETQKQMLEEYKTNPEIRKIVEKLKKEHSERKLPV